jgi:hypothetical protein
LKVQHKQIPRQEFHDLDALQDCGGSSSSGMNLPRQYPSLPPSGPNATQHLWFDTARNPEEEDGGISPDPGSGDTADERQDDDSPPPPVRPNNHNETAPTDENASISNSVVNVDVVAVEKLEDHEDDTDHVVSPLANFGQLRSALPDTTGEHTEGGEPSIE